MGNKKSQKQKERESRNKRKAKHRMKLESRKGLAECGRFLLDTERRVIHDLAMEKDTCEFENLFASGNARSHAGSLQDAMAEGFMAHEDCLGESPADTFEGSRTLLLVANVPKHSATPIEVVIEREEFKKRLFAGLLNNRSDEDALNRILSEAGAQAWWYQLRQLEQEDLDPDAWGEPDVVFALNLKGRPASLSREDDILADFYVPRSVFADENKLRDFARKFLAKLLEVPTMRKSLDGHARRYDYRDLAVYVHSCNSVDEFVIHRTRPKCTSSSGGVSHVAGVRG